VLELNSTRQKAGETVEKYSGRIEKLFHELCNVSVTGRKTMEAEAIQDYIKETTLTSYIEGLHQNLRQITKFKNLSSLEEAIKESLEEEKLLQSNKQARRLFQNNRTGTNSNQKYCSIYRENNHNTVQCRFSGENKQKQETYHNVNNSQLMKAVKKLTCTYCKATDHENEDYFKKKKADNRQDRGQPSISGNTKEPDKMGVHPVCELK